jgi:hypothetical protein
VTVTITPNPARTHGGASIRANPVARGSAVAAIAWDNVLNKPAILDNLDDLTGVGLLAQTDASGSVAVRDLIPPAAGLTITNPGGVAGNPTLVLANDLAAIEALSSAGIAVRTATDTWAQRTITGTANEITATNGDGVSGNPTLSLPTALTFTGKTITGGTYVSPTIDASIMFTDGGSNRVGLDLGTQNVMAYSGQGNSKTIAIHLNPGSGTLPTDTIAEVVLQRTADQAFGSNYGRWSFTALGSALFNLSGIYGEFGGTVTPTDFVLNLGIENPASTFTSYEFLRCFTQASGSSIPIGAVGIGGAGTTQKNILVLEQGTLGAPGTLDSNTIMVGGKSNDGSEHAIRWRQWVDVTSNAGASTYVLQSQIDAAGWNTRLSISDAGALAATTASLTTSLTSPTIYGGTAAGSSLVLDSTSNGSPSGDSIQFAASKLLYGVTTAQTMGASASINPTFQLFAGAAAASFGLVRETTPGGGGALLVMGASRSTPSTASYSALQSGDGLGSLVFVGDTSASLNAHGATVQAQSEGTWTASSSPARLSFGTTPSGATNTTEAFRLDSNQEAYFPNIGTTASAANAFLDSGSSPANQLLRSTSSLRYKTDVEVVTYSEALAVVGRLDPIKYRSLAKADDKARQFFGLGAETVADADARLVNYRDGLPDGVQYDRVGVLLIPIVQELARRAGLLDQPQ